MLINKKLIYIIINLLFLVSCAEPKYILDQSNNNQNTFQEEFANCQISFSKSGLCLSWSWEKKPNSKETGTIIFKTYRLNLLDQSPVEMDLTSPPHVVLWMPSMGHGSTPTETFRLDTGTYRVSNVFFIMPGDWEIRFQVKNGSQVIDETLINLVF